MTRTVGLDLAILVLDDFAELWPLSEILKVEADVVRFSEVIQVARVKFEEVHGCHWPNGDHVGNW